MTETADAIVIGLGAVGAATLYQLARRGVRVLGIDRFAPPHDRGSSHGETRVTRQAIGEGEIYVRFAQRSHEIWRELEAQTGERLLFECGFAAIDGSGGASLLHGKAGFVQGTIDAARRSGIAHELLSADELMARSPAFLLRGDEQIYYEPGGGLVYPERCIAAQLGRACALGADVRLNEPVASITPLGATVRVETVRGVYEAPEVVMAAGGWTLGLVGEPMRRFRLLRQLLLWFPPARPEIYRPGRFPTFIWTHGAGAENSFYGFPMESGAIPAVKLATEQYSTEMAAPEALIRTVEPEEATAMHAVHADRRLSGLSPTALRSTACFYTNAPDGDFAIGRHPDAERILVASACSGHGFKHSAGVGEHLARTVVGEDRPDGAFALTRASLC